MVDMYIDEPNKSRLAENYYAIDSQATWKCRKSKITPSLPRRWESTLPTLVTQSVDPCLCEDHEMNIVVICIK